MAYLLKETAFQFSSLQSLSCVRLFVTPWVAVFQASLSITNFRSSLRLASIESVMTSSHLSWLQFYLVLSHTNQTVKLKYKLMLEKSRMPMTNLFKLLITSIIYGFYNYRYYHFSGFNVFLLIKIQLTWTYGTLVPSTV